MLISGFGMVDSIDTCVTMDAKASGNKLVLVGETKQQMGGSHLLMIDPDANCDNELSSTSLTDGPRNAKFVHSAIKSGLVVSAHDCSEGGILVAAAEMAFGGNLGLDLQLKNELLCFSETASRYLLEVTPENIEQLQKHFDGVPIEVVGAFNDGKALHLGDATWNIDELMQCWLTGMVI